MIAEIILAENWVHDNLEEYDYDNLHIREIAESAFVAGYRAALSEVGSKDA